MPRIIFGADAPPLPEQLLARALAEELTSTDLDSGRPLPLILERHVRGTKSRHVWVVWDRWDDCDEEERSNIIRQAYTLAEGIEVAESLAVASGVLPREAARFGLVPFIVQPAVPSFVERTDYRQAKAREARNTVMGEAARQLRYPTEEEARRAVERLAASQPGTEWAIHRDDEEDEG